MSDVWPGRSAPLGAHWDGAGTNVAVHAVADGLDLCLADGATLRLPERTGTIWHGYVPGLGPGARYGLRAHGPGRDPAKLLVDPYARALDGGLRWDAAAFAPGADTAGRVPWSVIVDPAYDWGPAEPRPRHDLADSVLYELHVRGFTAAMPELPAAIRGTYAGLAHPAATQRLQALGITAVELLPVHHFVTEPHLQRKGLTNVWGYSSIGWSAPHQPYAATADPVTEFKAMVRALHAAGIEVLLDVVYNHTAEGEASGPTMCWRGLDDATYYRHHDGRYEDVTGCGNTVDAREPIVVRTILDSLRYWVAEMHIDGFRFDLASALARGEHGFDRRSALLTAVGQDPLLADVKLIAEPWDVGPGGHQTGSFPAPWAEWNDRFRAGVRDAWRGTSGGVADLACALAGSSELYRARGPAASVNYVTAHDGFTLADLVAYDQKHNEANGEQGRDGTDDNRSWHGGVEGPTDDPAVLVGRRTRARSMLATLLLSAGVPMLLAGDERGRTQGGNNNAYCQDGPAFWVDWTGPAADPARTAMVAALIALRRAHPALRQRAFFTGGPVEPDGQSDLVWYGVDGSPIVCWQQQTLGMYVAGDALRTRGPRGETLVDDSYLLWLNPQPRATIATLPRCAASHHLLLDTAADDPIAGRPVARSLELAPWSVVLLRAAP